MIRVGITGQAGFVGQHLYNTLKLSTDTFECIPFKKEYFNDADLMDEFVSHCDVIIHLAAMNRHADANYIYDTNIDLVKNLIASLNRTNAKPHVLFSSSTQEEKDNLYGRSKKEGRELLSAWANTNGGRFTALVIPNVYGPFGLPNYNSVVATFCHQLTHKQTPKIDVDGQINLIYVADLVNEFIKAIQQKIEPNNNTTVLKINHTNEIKVSALLALLTSYKEQYLEQGIIPNIDNKFEMNLFNTFRCYIPFEKIYPTKYTVHTDVRGNFAEVIRLNIGGQVSFSTTLPNVTRGNHFHTRKIERFSVIKGKALIQLRKIGTSEVLNFLLDGSEPAYIDMPIWYTHNIKNIGDEELFTIFWINEFYNPNDPDTFFENV